MKPNALSIFAAFLTLPLVAMAFFPWLAVGPLKAGPTSVVNAWLTAPRKRYVPGPDVIVLSPRWDATEKKFVYVSNAPERPAAPREEWSFAHGIFACWWIYLAGCLAAWIGSVIVLFDARSPWACLGLWLSSVATIAAAVIWHVQEGSELASSVAGPTAWSYVALAVSFVAASASTAGLISSRVGEGKGASCRAANTLPSISR